MARFFHPLLTLIASATDRELAKYVQFLKEENKILRKRAGGEIHTRPEERQRLIQFGKALGRAIEELITIVSPGTFYRWMRDEGGKKKTYPKDGQRKPREVRECFIEIAKTTGFVIPASWVNSGNWVSATQPLWFDSRNALFCPSALQLGRHGSFIEQWARAK